MNLKHGISTKDSVLNLVASVMVLTCAVSGLVHAEQLSDPDSFLGARSLARGGATVASNLGHDSLFQNPASASFVERYAVTLGYLGLGDTLTASIVDTKSGPIGGGAFYLRRDLSQASDLSAPLGDSTQLEERAGFSLLGRPAAGLGLGANIKYAMNKPYDTSLPRQSEWNFDVGLRYMVNPQLVLGVVGQNLLNTKLNMQTKQVSAGAEARLGNGIMLSAQLKKLGTINGSNYTVPGSAADLGWSAGVDYALPQGFSMRAGYFDNKPWSQRIASAGLGLDLDTFSMDYAFQKVIEGGNLSTHSVAITGYF